jgi:hypothetical protein
MSRLVIASAPRIVDQMTRRALVALALVAALAACTTGEKITDIHEGMTETQVISMLGRPDGFWRSGNMAALTYSDRLVSGWSWDRADYQVILTDGHVTAYGPGAVRQSAVNTLIIVPVR